MSDNMLCIEIIAVCSAIVILFSAAVAGCILFPIYLMSTL